MAGVIAFVLGNFTLTFFVGRIYEHDTYNSTDRSWEVDR